MNAMQFLMLRTAATVAALPATCMGAGFLCDPVVTHTNGMRMASSTSLRSHNAYWQCDPGHIGYCDGHYNHPCFNATKTHHWGRFVPPPTPMGATSSKSVHMYDGLEMATSESLGTISPDGVRPPTLQPGAAPALPSEGSGGIWIDAINSIGRRVMPAPGG